MKTGSYLGRIGLFLPFWTSVLSLDLASLLVEGFETKRFKQHKLPIVLVRDVDTTYCPPSQDRRVVVSFLTLLAKQCLQPSQAMGFEGGIGGLGKTKPQTGVVLWDSESSPFQSTSGVVSAELNVANRAVLVSFRSPWPLTGPLETRSVSSGESAFVQVVESTLPSQSAKGGKEAMTQLLLNSVLAQQGKFGAYGSPFDIRVRDYLVRSDLVTSTVFCKVSFTTLTPGLRESEREVYVKAIDAFNDNKHWVVLVTGMTKQGFSKQNDVFVKVADSFQVIPAPQSKLRKSQV